MSDVHTRSELVRLILDHAPITIWGVTRDGRVTLSEGRANVAAGRPFLGRNLFDDLGGPEHPVWALHERAFAGELVRERVEFQGVAYDATYIPIRDESGEVIEVLGVGADVTDRVAAREELRRSTAINAVVVDNIPAGVVLVQNDGQILEANTKAIEFLGLTRDELTGRVVQDFETETILEDGRPCPAELYPVVRCLQTGEPQPSLLLGVRRPDCSLRWAVFSAVPAHHPDSGEMLGAIVSFHDVTEARIAEEQRKELEEQLARAQKMEAIGRLAGGIAHDFNNLLVAVLGHAELIRVEAGQDEEILRSADTIIHASQQAARLTEQLLGFARRGKRQLVPIDLDHQVRTVLQLLSRTIDKRIVVRHEPHTERAWIEGDPGQIEQVLVNLALNARDAMPSGGVLTFTTSVDPGAFAERHGTAEIRGPRVRLTVRDSGTGIPPEVREQIFEPFFTTKEVGKGTGMGLAVAYGIIRNHGGWLRLAPTKGEGTTFVIELPRVALGPLSEAPASRPIRDRIVRVLLVDDEALVRDVTEQHLVALGHRVEVAMGGVDAIEKYRANPDAYDVVLLDLMMPGMRGDDCFRELLKIDPTVRVVLCTGYGNDGVVSDALGDGMLGYLAKPFSRSDLARALNDALSGSD